MKMDVSVRGLRELDRELSKMSERSEHKTLVSAGRRGAGYLRTKLKKKLPEGPNKPFYIRGKQYKRKHLVNSMGVMKKKGSRHSAEVWLGYRGQANFYGHIVEFGNSEVDGTHDWEQTFNTERENILAAMVKKLRDEIIRRYNKALDQE